MMYETDFLILGAGLTGLSAASDLGDSCIVLERENRPGGLVRTEQFDGYWFDHVIHLLHFDKQDIAARMQALMGDILEPCYPDACIETPHGTACFPLQTHLCGLDKEVVARCLVELGELVLRPNGSPCENYEEFLQRSFGPTLCEMFFFPYNRKNWKRPLHRLANRDFVWNIATPDFEQVVRGALGVRSGYKAYNSNGWYPRPPADSPLRGMELLPDRLAESVYDLRLNHVVEAIDLTSHVVTARHEGRQVRFRFRQGCLSTIPLPVAVRLCQQVPATIRLGCRRLTYNRVRTVALSIRGPRPVASGLWRYYADESLVFNRLIYMHEFDALTAPPDGWGLMAEVTERAEDPPMPDRELIGRVRFDAERAGAIPDDCEVINTHVLLVEPAYVVFSLEDQEMILAARDYLSRQGITPLGRYGRWEYSSMAQALRAGFDWANWVREPTAALAVATP